MKQKISITIDEEIITLIEDKLQDPQFRNRSHVIEHALHQSLKKQPTQAPRKAQPPFREAKQPPSFKE